MKVDTREFQRVAEALLTTSSRTYPQFVNGQMLNVARLALKLTEKADRRKIESQMGVVKSRQTLRSGKAGAKGWVRITKRVLGAAPEDTMAGRILLARHAKTGEWTIKGATFADKVIALIAAKVRSVAFIKSGWIPAIRELSKLVYGSRGGLDGAKQVGAPKGYAVPARFTISGLVTCTIANTALLHESKFNAWHGRKGNPFPIAEKGLRVAMEVATRDMASEFFKRMKIDLKPFGGTLGP